MTSKLVPAHVQHQRFTPKRRDEMLTTLGRGRRLIIPCRRLDCPWFPGVIMASEPSRVGTRYIPYQECPMPSTSSSGRLERVF